ncbi:DUF6415 family natural product biosynthesis protein [Streptomyces sp. NPDC093060]|uniref:DUF6415 family natural product biosynthesis protein n=1 Tax=Streptomyces sp. NPDC093060 TaxID=3366019 RepID=UPI0037FF81BD
MNQPTDRAAPDYTPAQVDALIAESAAATGILPTIDRCHHLNRQLRAAIQQLADQVRQRQAAFPERSRDWYRCDRLLTDTGTVLAEGMGHGLLSAALHVAALGRQAQALAAEERRA